MRPTGWASSGLKPRDTCALPILPNAESRKPDTWACSFQMSMPLNGIHEQNPGEAAQQAVEADGRAPSLAVTASISPVQVARARSSLEATSAFPDAPAAERRYVGQTCPGRSLMAL